MWLRVCPIDQLIQGTCISFEHDDGYMIIAHLQDGFFAMDNICPHQEADLHMGDLEDDCIYCPLHQWCFNLKNGHCALGPDYNLTTYAVKKEDGYLWVDPESGMISQED